MSERNTCEKCGGGLREETAGGLCPRCLMALSFASRTMPEGEAPELTVSLSPEEMREHFPQFEIIEYLGRGGMGVVYKARQKALDRLVAIKVLAGERQDDVTFARRFEREAKMLAQMSHPNIVTVHDFGEADGLYYLVMEYVDGVNLRDLLADGKIDPKQALAIVPPICEALEYAHDKGVVHRDIKPENLLLDREGRVKIADFGIASLVGAEGEKSGTPPYMAPEQENGVVDRRADIYALGAVLYEMLTGERPARDLVAPSKRVQIDVRIDAIVLRALEKEPERRYQTAAEFRTVIETVMTAPPEPTGEEAMDIEFNCPKCHRKLAVDPSAAGAAVDCPACSEPLIVPAAPKMKIKRRSPAPSSPPPVPSSLPKTQPKRARGLAIAALALGIVGLVPILGLATGILGLALGIAALVKRTTSKGVAIAGTVTGGLATLMIPLHIGLLIPAVLGASFAANTAVCATNLKTIGLGIASYQQEHNGDYPARLDALVTAGALSAKTLQCPLHTDSKGAPGYDYARPADVPQGMLAWDSHPHRMGKKRVVGRNVLYADLSVRFLAEQQFQEALKTTVRKPRPTPQPSRTSRPGAPGTPASVPTPTPTPTTSTPPPPAVPPLTVASASAALQSAPARDHRRPLQFLAQATVEPELRDAVVAAVKPLLNDVDNGELAFQAFANWADKEQVPDLIDFVRIAPRSPRGKQAMKMLSRMGDARAAEPLAACLTDFHSLRDVKAALAALGDIAKPAVLPYYHHEDRNAREAARELLRGYQITDEEIFAESIRALSTAGLESRRSAMSDLSTANLTPDQRTAAARALRPLVVDSDAGVRDAARRAMKTLATPADADFLLAQLGSTDDATRQFATELLVRFKDARAAKPIAMLLSDSRKTHAAGKALIDLGSAAESAVVPYLRHDDWGTRKRASEILAEIGTSASLPALQAAAKDTNFHAKVAAERAINSIKSRPAGANRQR